jgi:large-conductance mechanosensitive channel
MVKYIIVAFHVYLNIEMVEKVKFTIQKEYFSKGIDDRDQENFLDFIDFIILCFDSGC